MTTDGGARNKERLIIFVHGFTGSPRGWDPLIKLLSADPEISSEFDFECFEYESPLIHFSLTTKLPSVQNAAERLSGLLGSSEVTRYREVTLVGHSQGGLVIQHALVKKLELGLGADLAIIRQVVLFATPNLGATIFSPVRQVLGHLPVFNRQETSLRVMDQDIADLRADVLRRIVAANAPGKYSYPVPFECFYGTEDGIVPEPSAAGHFLNVQAIKGNHSSILQPKDSADERYTRFKEALLNPRGHLHVFEIDLYEDLLQIWPTDGVQRVKVRHGNVEREVETETEAHIVRRAKFSSRNTCDDLFEMRYATRREGFVFYSHEGVNEAPVAHQSHYLDYGTSYSYQFRPIPGKAFELDLKILKGFDRGNRDFHVHLRKREFIKEYFMRLDLSAFVANAYKVYPEPKLYYDPREFVDHGMCDNRSLPSPIPYSRVAPEGVWEWTIKNVQYGVVDLRWDASK